MTSMDIFPWLQPFLDQIEAFSKLVEEHTPANVYVDDAGDLIFVYLDGSTQNVGHVLGAPGVSITAASVNDVGDLIITFSTGITSNAGHVLGQNGVSVINATVNGSGDLIITLSNAQTINTGHVAGVSITSAVVNGSGDLIITLSNGTVSDAGHVLGAPGAGLNPAGPYDPVITYPTDSLVTYQGSSFYNIAPSLGIAPGDPDAPAAPWFLFAAKGASGGSLPGYNFVSTPIDVNGYVNLWADALGYAAAGIRYDGTFSFAKTDIRSGSGLFQTFGVEGNGLMTPMKLPNPSYIVVGADSNGNVAWGLRTDGAWDMHFSAYTLNQLQDNLQNYVTWTQRQSACAVYLYGSASPVGTYHVTAAMESHFDWVQLMFTYDGTTAATIEGACVATSLTLTDHINPINVSGALATFSSTVMTVTQAPSAGSFAVGQIITSVNIAPGTTIIPGGSGTGGTGTYVLSQPVTTVNTPQAVTAGVWIRATFNNGGQDLEPWQQVQLLPPPTPVYSINQVPVQAGATPMGAIGDGNAFAQRTTLYSDWMQISSFDRIDLPGALPLAMSRAYVSGVPRPISYMPNGAWFLFDNGRTLESYFSLGNHVSSPADQATFAPEAQRTLAMTPTINYYSRRAGVTIMVVGDSIAGGFNSTFNMKGFVPRTCDAVSTLDFPVQQLQYANPGLGVSQFEFNANNVLGQFKPQIVVIEVGTLNFNGYATQAVALDGWQKAVALANRVRAYGGCPIYFLPPPSSTLTAVQNANRMLAVNTALASGELCINGNALWGDPSNPAILNPIYNSGDNVHINDAGYELASSTVFTPMVKKILAKKV